MNQVILNKYSQIYTYMYLHEYIHDQIYIISIYTHRAGVFVILKGIPKFGLLKALYNNNEIKVRAIFLNFSMQFYS